MRSSQPEEAGADPPGELRLDPAWGAGAGLLALLAPASLGDPGLTKTCFPLCVGGYGVTESEGLASLDSVRYSARAWGVP